MSRNELLGIQGMNEAIRGRLRWLDEVEVKVTDTMREHFIRLSEKFFDGVENPMRRRFLFDINDLLLARVTRMVYIAKNNSLIGILDRNYRFRASQIDVLEHYEAMKLHAMDELYANDAGYRSAWDTFNMFTSPMVMGTEQMAWVAHRLLLRENRDE